MAGGAGRLIQVELPFLWRETGQTGEGACLEGVMDLAVYTESESAWRVIDWKTNRLGPMGSGGLVEIYRGQICAYARALREMLSAEVRGSLYLTQTGSGWTSPRSHVCVGLIPPAMGHRSVPVPEDT